MNKTWKKEKDTKKIKPALIILAAVLLWAGVGIFIAVNYIFAGGRLISRKTDNIDLSGKNVSVTALKKLRSPKEIDLLDSNISFKDYETLRSCFPECHIRWSVPLSSGRFDSESEELRISSITEEDIDMFSLFRNLKKIGAEGIPDWEKLSKLESRYPSIEVDWGVEIGGKYYSSKTAELHLENSADTAEMMEKLSAFTGLKEVFAENSSFSINDQLALTEKYPDLVFNWPVKVTPEGISSTAETIDLAGNNNADLDLLIKCAPLFTGLKTIDFSGCSYSNDEMKEVADAYPDTDVLWQFTIYDQEVSSLDEEIDFSGKKIDDTSEIENALPYLRKIKKVIMSDCGIKNEDMDALNKRHENVKFVWTVYFGTAYHLRTDDKVFIASLFFGAPNTGRNDLNDYNFAPIKYCTDLIAVDVGHQHIRDCSVFSEMKNLKWLIIAMSSVSDISPLANCKELFYLEMFLCPVHDLSPLLECKKLRHLNICQCPTRESLDVLAQMTWLERCWMSGGFTYDDRVDWEYVHDENFLPHTMKRLRGLDHTGDGWRNYPTYFEMRDVFNGPHYPTWWSSNEWRNNPNVVVPEGFIEEHGLDEENND